MAAVIDQPGFVTFAPPPELSMEEMAIRDMLVEEGRVPPLGGIPTAKKAAAITSGLTLAPIASILIAQNLAGAKIFFDQLFGRQGADLQERAVRDTLSAAEGKIAQNPGLDEFLKSTDPNVESLRNRVMFQASVLERLAGTDIGAPGFMAPSAGMTGAQLEERRAQVRSEILQTIKIKLGEGLSPDDIFRDLRAMFESGTVDPNIFPSPEGIQLMIESVFAGMQQPAFAADPTGGTNATQPDPAIQAESPRLQAIIDEKNRRKKEDELLGLRVGQKAHQLDDVERLPDQWLARVQANRQALLARQIPRTPMQMRNDGLVQQVYYSTRVQQ